MNLVIKTLELIQKTVELNCVCINHCNAQGCCVIHVIERTISTGIFTVIDNQQHEEIGAAYGG